MLRWCQKTCRILDDSPLIWRTRYHVSSVQHASIARAPGQTHSLNSAFATKAHQEHRIAERSLSSNCEHKATLINMSPNLASSNKSCLIQALHCPADASNSPTSSQTSSTPKHSRPKHQSEQLDLLRSLLPWHREQSACVTDIVKQYRRISKQGQRTRLDALDFTNLVAFFGHLNHHSTVEEQYASPYAKSVQQRGKKNLRILFLLEVANDMREFGLLMSERDKYWIMQTYLLEVAGAPSPDLLLKRLDQARLFYLQLSYPQDVAAQVDFVSYLAKSKHPLLVQEAVSYVCDFLKHPGAPDSFVRMFCSLVQISSELSPSAKEQICSALRLRLDRHLADNASFVGSDPQALDISQLVSSFVHTVFHPSSSLHPKPLSDWSRFQCQQSFSPSLPLERIWDNLTLLAVHCNPTGLHPSTSNDNIDSFSLLWRTSFILDALVSHLGNSNLSSEQLSVVKQLARTTWTAFASADHQLWPVDMIRVLVSAFLRISAITFSEGLRQQCLAYLRRNRLLEASLGSRQQALQLCLDYLQAYISCEGQNWSEIETIVDALCPDSEFEVRLSNQLLQHYIDADLAIASNIYLFSIKRSIHLDPRIIQELALRFIAEQQWSSLAVILRDPSLPGRVADQLFVATLRHFQINRLEYAPYSLVKLLGERAITLYSQKAVPPASKYPLRYLLGLMVASHSTQLIDLIRTVRSTTPDILSPHLLDRLASGLTRRRQLEQAAALVKLVSDEPSPSTSALQSKIAVQAVEKGAPGVAKCISSLSSNPAAKTSKSLRLARALRFGTFPKTVDQIKHVVSLLREVNNTPTSICRGIGMLVKAKKMYLARKLLRDKADQLDIKMKTMIGNTILHAPMGRLDLRNGRLVRYVLRTKDLLMEGYGFVPDRATLNIIVKAVLRWQGMVDASQVRRLFDQMVHEGYPVSEHWRKKHGVPFGTPPGTNERIALPSLAPHISFAKHTRPLYKLFIKAFYLRHDVSAAKTVVGILKEVEVDDIREREKRNRARREGIIKKRKRELMKAPLRNGEYISK